MHYKEYQKVQHDEILQEMSFHDRRPLMVPMLLLESRKSQLLWALKHQNKITDVFKKVVWFCESWFFLYHADDIVRIWRKQDEVINSSWLRTTFHAIKNEIIIWVVFNWSTMGSLEWVEAPLNSTTYFNVVANPVLPLMTAMFSDDASNFRQNRSPWQSSRIVSDWCEEHDFEFEFLP